MYNITLRYLSFSGCNVAVVSRKLLKETTSSKSTVFHVSVTLKSVPSSSIFTLEEVQQRASVRQINAFAIVVSAEVKSVSIDVGKEEVLVESSLTSTEVQALIENTGRRAVLKGIGGSEQGEELQNTTCVLLKCLYFLE